jgi:long-chain acyl-CoA synthetase
MGKGQELTGIKKKLFFWAVDLGSRFEVGKKMGWWYDFQLGLANKLIFKKWREGLGGNVKAIVTGAAACQVRLLRVFTAGNIVIMEGYGLTETSPVISVNRYEAEGRCFGTVGPVIKNTEVKLAEDGEICCRGENVMMGYYKRPDLTSECIDQDGWFHTGDIGVWVDNKFLKITDRKKELFKSSAGKYISPVALENKLKECKYIEQCMVIGEGQKFASAIIVANMISFKEYCANNNTEWKDAEKMIESDALKTLINDHVKHINKSLAPYEQLKRCKIINANWTVESGEITPKLSLKRKVIKEKNKQIIDKIFVQED